MMMGSFGLKLVDIQGLLLLLLLTTEHQGGVGNWQDLVLQVLYLVEQ